MKTIRITALAIILTHFMGCSSDNRNLSTEKNVKNEVDSIQDIQDTLTVLTQPDTEDGFDVVFDENKGLLGIKVDESKDFITIGSLHNTFEQPPHDIRTEKLDGDNYAIFVFTNHVQLGTSEDQVNVFRFNRASKGVSKLCSFEELGVYNEESGIDTMEGIKLYDYRLSALTKGKYIVEISEYKPYKYDDASKNQNLKYSTTKKSCNFSIN